MTTNDLVAIRARAEAATRGPWQSIDITDEDDDFCGYWTITKPGETGVDRWLIDDMETLTGQDMADADFVAHARTDVPALCDEVEALRGELARARDCPNTRKSYEKLQVEHAALREYTTGLESKLAAYLRDAGREEGE